MSMRDDCHFVYPPDYVSADTLAYRLDCSRATIDAYVKEGRLPRPEMIGNLVRWDFAEVRAFIKARNSAVQVAINNGILHNADDPYLEALNHSNDVGSLRPMETTELGVLEDWSPD